MNTKLIYGGCFDPVHNGHLNTAIAVQNYFKFNDCIFLPCKDSLLKPATMASCDQRLAMLKLALENHPEFLINLSEITRNTDSYMLYTLEEFHKQAIEPIVIILLMGMDSWLQFHKWYHWQKIMDLCHILIVDRKSITTNHMESPILKNLLMSRETKYKEDLHRQPYGKIYQFNAGNHPISSSYIRQQIQQNKSKDIKNLLSEQVYQFILDQELYR